MAGYAGSRDRRAAHEERRARRAAVTDPETVMEAAAQFLAVRSRSVAETRRRLLHLGYGEVVTEEVLEQLRRLGYLDDHAFARAWVESRDRSRPRGETALRQELRQKGVDDAIVRATLAERDSPSGFPGHGDQHRSAVPGADIGTDAPRSAEREAARRLLARKAASLAREPDLRRRRQKAYALLARNGFDPGICRDMSLDRPGATVDDDAPESEDG